MIIKQILFYIKQFLIFFPCHLFHESCHYIISCLFYCFGYISFPKIIIKGFPFFHIGKDDTLIEYGFQMYVSYENYFDCKTIDKIIAFFPVIGIVSLFLFSPFYMYIYYIAGGNYLYLSVSDIRTILK